MELTPLSRKRATDEVYEAMRQAILSRTFLPGERLNVEEIATKLGVSLTPIRHALQQLATEGLVDIQPRSGTYVANLSPRDLEETFDIRCALECLAAEKAAERGDPAVTARLRELLSDLARPLETAEDRQRHEESNLEFHRVIVGAAGSRKLAEMYESLNAHIQIARVHRSEEDWPGRLAEEQREHEAIVAALEARDIPALTASVRAHILRARDALVAKLAAGPAGS